MIGVYRIFNTETGRSYVGSSEDVENRLLQHFYNMDRGVNGWFYDDLILYKKESFKSEILKTMMKNSELESYENYYIGKFDSIDNGYNKILSRRPQKTPVVRVENVIYEMKSDQLLNKFEVAVELKLSESTLNEIVLNDKINHFKIGREKRYLIKDILDYFKNEESKNEE